MIQFETVTKQYRGNAKPALDRVSLNIARGEFVFIVGASGSGKSSCLQLMLREEQPTSGQINVLGHDLGNISTRKVPYFRRNLGVVFQDFRLLTNKTVYDNVAFTLQVIGKSRGYIQEAVPDTLEMVGLGGKGKRFPHELSGGEQQRVAIARAIVNKPAILLADEPTGNLDPGTSLGIMQLLQAINAAGTTVVMATHEAGFVDIMQQRVIELSQGVIVRDEREGGYGVTAAMPIAVDLAARDTPLVLRESTIEEPVSDETVIRQHEPQPVMDAPGVAPAAEPAQQPQTVAAQPAAARPESVAESAAPAEPAEPAAVDDPIALSQTGTLAQQLGLNVSDADEQNDVGPVR